MKRRLITLDPRVKQGSWLPRSHFEHTTLPADLQTIKDRLASTPRRTKEPK